MKRLVAAIALSAPLAAMGAEPYLGDPRLALIDDPLRVEFRSAATLTKEKIRRAIAIAALSWEWKILAETDGRSELIRTVNSKHVMRVDVVYDPAGYAVRYLDSTNLLYEETAESGGRVRAIHRNYNIWIGELATTINSNLGVSTSITGKKTA